MSVNSIESYQYKKEQLIKQFAAANPNQPFRLKKKTSNLFRHRQNTSVNWLDLNQFNQVIHIDVENLQAEVEGLITYKDFVAETLKYHCLPAIVPELKSITVGGAIAGLGAESSSFRHGWVHETAVELEVLLGNGEVVTCAPDNIHRDLYYAFPSSYGTLGYILKAKMRLIPVKPFVKLQRLHFTDPKKFFAKLAKLTDGLDADVAFIDAMGMGDDLHISMGSFTDHAPYVSDYSYRHIYYRSIPLKHEDYLTVHDYIWRWDADWFWCSKYFFMENTWLRLLLGKWMLKSTAYWRIMHFINTNRLGRLLNNFYGKKTETIIQDLQIPIEQAESFYYFFKDRIQINPMLICPIKINSSLDPFLFCKMDKNKLYINFGAYGNFIPSTQEKGYFNKLIETQVRQCGGNKWLYSNVFYSEDEFWNLFDKQAYFAAKKHYDPEGRLGDIYKKCSEKM